MTGVNYLIWFHIHLSIIESARHRMDLLRCVVDVRWTLTKRFASSFLMSSANIQLPSSLIPIIWLPSNQE
uniref:Uncharacterized protein n=1 Tax=Pararge aegeria TaxID=116150 RepID=S4P8B3_9NEOP